MITLGFWSAALVATLWQIHSVCGDVRGFEASIANAHVDMKKLRADGNHFVYLKTSEGFSYEHLYGVRLRAEDGPGQARYLYILSPFKNTTDALPDAVEVSDGTWASDTTWCDGIKPVDFRFKLWDFLAEYRRLSGRFPIIKTHNASWNKCTGSSPTFWSTSLWIDEPTRDDEQPKIPASWKTYVLSRRWPSQQDQVYTDMYNGDLEQLMHFTQHEVADTKVMADLLDGMDGLPDVQESKD